MERVLGITRDGSELRLAVAVDWKREGFPSRMHGTCVAQEVGVAGDG